MKFIYFKKSNGDLDSMPFREGLETAKKVKEFLGLDEISEFEILEGTKTIATPKPVLIEKLWNDCKRYNESKISTAGMVYLSRYLDNTLVKKIYDWIDALWADYYARKDVIEAGGEPSFDFSNNGELPHTFLEVRQDIEGV
jgi:hypothetical protein